MMKRFSNILFIAFLALVATSVNGFDGFKLDDMGNPVQLNNEAPKAKPAVSASSLQGQGMERFRETNAAPVHPEIAKLINEKTEIGIKLAQFEPMKEHPKKGISAEELEQLNSFREKVGELQRLPEGAKLLGKMAKRLSQNPHENVDSFLNLLFSLRKSLASAKKDSKQIWKKVKGTCEDSEQESDKKINELKGRKEKATRDLQSIRTRLADANSKLAQARSKATPAKGGPAKAIAMLEILEHNVANHIPNRGVPMIKPQSIDALANAISGTAPGVFNVASKTISSLIEITGSGDDDEEIYCPENFCQRSKKRDANFHGPRSAFIECFKKETQDIRLPTIWTAAKGAKKRVALLNSGMHRQVCTVEGKAGKSPKQKVYGLLKRLRNALSGSSPVASADVVVKQLEEQQKGAKEESKKAAVAGKADDAHAELIRLEAVVDGLLSDEAATEAAEQNYHVLLGQERKFKLDLLRACEEKAKRQSDEQGARKSQVNAVDLAVALVKRNMILLKHFLKGGNPMTSAEQARLNDEAELMLDPDMAAAKALAEAKKKQRDASITKGIKSIGALGVDPSLVKLQLLSVKRGCVPGKELWCGTKRQCIDTSEECPSAPTIMKDEQGNQVVSQGQQAAFVFEDPLDKEKEDAELDVIREKASMIKQKVVKRKKQEELRKKYEEKIKRITKRKEELKKGAEADMKKMKRISAKAKIAEAKANKLAMDAKNMKLDIMSLKDDLEHFEKECSKYERRMDEIENQTSAMAIEEKDAVNRAKKSAMGNAEDLIQEEDDIVTLRKKSNAATAAAREAAANVTKATQDVKDAEARYGDNARTVAAASKVSLLQINERAHLRSRSKQLAGYGGYGGYGGGGGEAVQAKAVAGAEKTKSYLLEARLRETEEMKRLKIAREEAVKASKKVLNAMKMASTMKSKEVAAKSAAENAEKGGEKTLKKLESELKIKTSQFKSCKRDKNAATVKIADMELKQATLDREAAEARVEADSYKSAMNKMKVAEQADEMEAAIIAEPLPEQSPIISVACGLYLSANECILDVSCGWIPGVGCKSGSKSGPYFWDEQLPGWQYRKLDNAKCESYSDCRQCIDAGCGWCGARLSCTEGGLYGPSNLESCPPEYMPQWAHKLGRGRNACPVRQVVQTESAMAQQFALRVALATRKDMAKKENEIEVNEEQLQKMRTANANKEAIKTMAQTIRSDRRSYEMLKAQLKGNVDELRHAEKGKARTYQAGYAEGLKLAERKHAQQEGYLQGLKEGIEKAKTMRGPQGPPGSAGPQGPEGRGVDASVVAQTIEQKMKALHGNEIGKAKRLAEEAVKAAKNQGKQLEKISGQELAATGLEGATGAAETGGATGLEAQREDAAAKLDAAKLDAKAAVTVAKAEGATGAGAPGAENVDSIDGGDANKQVEKKLQDSKVQKAVQVAAASGAAGAAGAVTNGKNAGSAPTEKGVTIASDNDEAEDSDMENTAKAEKDGIKNGLSPTEKAAMESSRASMQAKLKESEDKWTVQVNKFKIALDEEKSTCGAAKAAALAAQELEKKKKELQNKILNMEKGGAKSRENQAKMTEEFEEQTKKVNLAKEKLEDAKLVLSKAPQQTDDPQFKAAKAKVDAADTELKSLSVTKAAAADGKKAAVQDAKKAVIEIDTVKKELDRVISAFTEKSEEAELKQSKTCPAARKKRTIEEAEAGKLKASYDKVKAALVKHQAMLDNKATAGVRNMSFALSVKGGPYISAGKKGYNVIKNKASKTVSVEAWVRLRAFAPEGIFMTGLVTSTGGNKGANGHGWALGADQNGFAFAFRREDKATPTTEMDIIRSSDPGAADDKAAGVKVELNKFYHVTATFTDKQAKLYINGKLANFKSYSPSTISYDVNGKPASGGEFTVGAMRKSSPSNAVVDDITVWSRELSTDEIKSHSCDAAASKKAMTASKDAALVLYYNFGPGDVPGLNVLDKSKNSLDGKIYAPENSSVKWLAEDVKQYKCSDLTRLGRSQTTSNLRRRR